MMTWKKQYSIEYSLFLLRLVGLCFDDYVLRDETRRDNKDTIDSNDDEHCTSNLPQELKGKIWETRA